MNFFKHYVVALALVTSSPLWASDDHDHEAEGQESSEHEDDHGSEKSPSVGSGKAIEDADEHKGIKLSKRAIDRIKLKTEPVVPALSGFRISRASLISERGKFFVYVSNGEWFEQIPVKVLKIESSYVEISGALKVSQHVVSEGAGLVRIAHLEAFGASGDGHGH